MHVCAIWLSMLLLRALISDGEAFWTNFRLSPVQEATSSFLSPDHNYTDALLIYCTTDTMCEGSPEMVCKASARL